MLWCGSMEPTIRIESRELFKLLHNAGLFAATDKDRPVLNAVRLYSHPEDPRMLWAEATNSYAMLRTCAPTATKLKHEVNAIVPLDVVKQVLHMLPRGKKYGRDPIYLTTTATGGIRVIAGEWEYIGGLVNGGFPDTSKFWEVVWPASGTNKASFTPSILKLIAALRLGPAPGIVRHGLASSNYPVTFWFSGTDKPASFTVGGSGDRIEGIIMPVRVAR